MMMSQKVKDIGLIKAAGCPNDSIFGYFMFELLIVTFLSCLLGTLLGVSIDFILTKILSSLGLQVLEKSTDLFLIFLIFALYFVLSILFGAKLILNTMKIKPSKALSPVYRFGLNENPKLKIMSKSGLTVKLGLRSLFRLKSATFRIVLCLSIVFMLLTVAVAGGIIANRTTSDWIEKAIGRDIVFIAHDELGNQYRELLSTFSEGETASQFNYADERYFVSEELQNKLHSISEKIVIDERLILFTPIQEIQGIIYGETSEDTKYVGGDKKGHSLVIGINPEKALSEWFYEGEYFREDDTLEAMIGDSIAHKMFSVPLAQSIKVFEKRFKIISVCLDPINNGNVTYVPIKTLQNTTGISKPNYIMIKIEPSANHQNILNQISEEVNTENSEFKIFELNEILENNLTYLNHLWSTVMILPICSLISAFFSLMGFLLLVTTEQYQEFGVIKALGAKSKTILNIVSTQVLVVLLTSFAVGLSFGIIITLMILIPEPIITSYTILEISGWLLAILITIYIFSHFPILKSAKKPIKELLTHF
jgi:ABC-type antimicrobial peptide transport system permease subunit